MVLFVGACDSQEQQNNFVDDAGATPSGFTRTDAEGSIISDDTDDWRTSPLYLGKVRLDPVYPNPSSGEFVTVPLSILEFNTLQGGIVLRAYDNSNRLRLLDEIDNTGSPGAYILRFSPAILGRTGLIRLFIFERIGGELISFGDLQVGVIG